MITRGRKGGDLLANMEKVKDLALDEKMVGGPLEGVLAVLVVVDGDRHQTRRLLLGRPPHDRAPRPRTALGVGAMDRREWKTAIIGEEKLELGFGGCRRWERTAIGWNGHGGHEKLSNLSRVRLNGLVLGPLSMHSDTRQN